MGFDRMLAPTNISASGLSAERLRMEVLANNIANAYSTRSPAGGPFRRQDVVFSAVLNDTMHADRAGGDQLGGVRVVRIQEDPSPLNRVYNPDHPDADSDGFVSMPNVDMPIEMVNLITASRAYEANLRVLHSFRQMAEQALTLARG
jgi:flagellar basal-body rod protein FlgC